MEIEYNIKLYYRIERLENVLLKLPAIADSIASNVMVLVCWRTRMLDRKVTSDVVSIDCEYVSFDRIVRYQYI
jgi:hypothetical protein